MNANSQTTGSAQACYKASKCTRISFVTDGVRFHTAMGQKPFFLCQPFSREWEVWETEEANGCNEESDCSLEDEKPLPASKSGLII